ncbi:alpha/beta fold hydrolase [Arthrobacter sp. NPDC058097]|uniref:alpha/beta fold hydrolase n=1 Tax=Arthrobacter sp. NPDC058097 TaxID=3346340 RepID=UPI0036DDE0D6
MPLPLDYLTTDTLDIAFERSGADDGFPVVLLHGFPYDPRSYDEAADRLVEEGAHVLVPYLRGHGPTRFRSAGTLRSGQQAALGSDLHDFIDGLGLDKPIVAGFDWGGRAACLTAMLWPEKVSGLVTIGGYNVHDVKAMATTPEPPAIEANNWHQWYFQNERGREGLTRYRHELARQLWCEGSPHWDFDDDTFEATATSFGNPDFVDVVIHSYRVRYELTPGDPVYDELERVIATQPVITVPTIVIDPTDDPITPPLTREEHEAHFARMVDYRRTPVGHNTPQEDPEGLATAILDVRQISHSRRADTLGIC